MFSIAFNHFDQTLIFAPKVRQHWLCSCLTDYEVFFLVFVSFFLFSVIAIYYFLLSLCVFFFLLKTTLIISYSARDTSKGAVYPRPLSQHQRRLLLLLLLLRPHHLLPVLTKIVHTRATLTLGTKLRIRATLKLLGTTTEYRQC